MREEVYPESYIDVKSICPNWITDNFLDFMDLKLEDFKALFQSSNRNYSQGCNGKYACDQWKK